MAKETINELLELVGEDFEVKLVPDSRPDLTDKERKEIVDYFGSFAKENAEKIGNFLYCINDRVEKIVSLSIYTTEDSENSFGNVNIVQNGSEVGKTCTFCIQRVKCLTQGYYECDVNEGICEKVGKKLKEKFDLSFNRDVLITLLEKEGFKQQMFLGIQPLDNVYVKDRMTVYIN